MASQRRTLATSTGKKRGRGLPITQCASVGESSAAPGRFEQKTSEGKMHKLALLSIQRGLASKVHQQAQAGRSSDDAEV